MDRWKWSVKCDLPAAKSCMMKVSPSANNRRDVVVLHSLVSRGNDVLSHPRSLT
jgi:invasion protein IalB